MNYEEYAERMRKQKREPRDREYYAEYTEKAYMAVGMDKDEFCALPEKAIDALEKLALAAERTYADLERENKARREAEEAHRAAEEANLLNMREVERLTNELGEANNRFEVAEVRAWRLEELLKKALAKWPVEMLVEELVAKSMK